MESFTIGNFVRIEEYQDRQFARWKIIYLVDGEEKQCGTVFQTFQEAVIYIGLTMDGMDSNSASHLLGFIADILRSNRRSLNAKLKPAEAYKIMQIDT